MSDDVLPRPGLGAHALDQGVVGVLLPGAGSRVTVQEHGTAPDGHPEQEHSGDSRGFLSTTRPGATFHYRIPWEKRPASTEKRGKIDHGFTEVANLG